MIPYFSLEMLRALLEWCGGRTPDAEDPYPAWSNPVKTHAASPARIRPSGVGRFGPESSTNERASRPNFWWERPTASPLDKQTACDDAPLGYMQ
jgi:hypothetical protein